MNEAPVTGLLGARQTGQDERLPAFSPSRGPGRDTCIGSTWRHRSIQRPWPIPKCALRDLTGLVVIDEIQRQPDLFRALRPLVDRPQPTCPLPNPWKRLSEPRAWRVGDPRGTRVQFVKVPGFSLADTGALTVEELWLRGGFPRAFLAPSIASCGRWRESFITTLLERDIPLLGIRIPPETLRRFLTMLCHFHGQTWNGAELARSLDTSEKTVRHYLDILAGAYLVRVLTPWHENIAKRQTKSPKVYIRDSGPFAPASGGWVHARPSLPWTIWRVLGGLRA